MQMICRAFKKTGQQGFALVLLLSWLPLFMAISAFVGHVLIYSLQQAKLRHHCIRQSFNIQRKLHLLRHLPAAFNSLSQQSSLKLEKELQIISPDIRRLRYPALRSDAQKNRKHRLAYKSKQTSGHEFICGIESTGEDIWDYKIIYESSQGRL